MKFVVSEMAYFLRGRARQNLRFLTLYCGFVVLMMVMYAVLFQYLQRFLEGEEYSFITGFYWVVTSMTTLGYGDITFASDAGRLFSTIVTLSGVIFLLIFLPFGMISLFLAPYIEDRMKYRPTLRLAEETSGHVVICGLDPTTRAFIRKLETRNIPFVVVTGRYEEAVRLEEEGIRVVYGVPSDGKVMEGARVQNARYVIANLSDAENANIVLTLRSLCSTPVAAIVDEPEHTEVLRLAGANHVIALKRILGRYLAIRSTTQGALAHIVDAFGPLLIAEVPVHGTPFVGQTLIEADIRRKTGLAVVGLWERGTLSMVTRETRLNEGAVMVLAGTREQLETLEQLTGEQEAEELVFIVGHGRIGCAAATFLDRKPVPYILVDREPNPACDAHVVVLGDAASPRILKEAAIDKAKGLIVTTNDDSTNIFLTLASRHLKTHMRIVARANREENVEQLYAAGAEFVVSNASVGASILSNVLENKETIFLTEGIHVFRRPLPFSLAGKRLRETNIRELSGCSIIALQEGDETHVMPEPETVLASGASLILIGRTDQENQFDKAFQG